MLLLFCVLVKSVLFILFREPFTTTTPAKTLRFYVPLWLVINTLQGTCADIHHAYKHHPKLTFFKDVDKVTACVTACVSYNSSMSFDSLPKYLRVQWLLNLILKTGNKISLAMKL